MRHSAEELALLSSMVDRWSALSEAEREPWLQGLSGEAARLSPALRKMLARQATGELGSFLEQPATLSSLAASAADVKTSDFQPGEAIGPYRLIRTIGRGGMGEVWLATRADGQLKRSVALKLPVLSLRRSVLAQRFERERDILSALIHPHIARLYDAGIAEDGQPFMALEYIEGTPITQAADEGKLDAEGRVRLLLQVMGAVQYAHANLVIHRDLKPGNVLTTAEGQTKLLDFGIAKLVEDEGTADSELTRAGGRALTLHYAAPELLSGAAATTAVDIWALGVLLYELVTGQRPFGNSGSAGRAGSKTDTRAVEREILSRNPGRPSQRKSGVMSQLPRMLAADLDTIVLKALKKDPTLRYASAGAFADDLDRWLRGVPVRAQRDSPWYRARKFTARHKFGVAAATLATAALIGVASVAVVLGLQAREESARARAARDFMVNIFREANPDHSQGKEVSAKQLLSQGYETVTGSMDSQPLLQAELLYNIGIAFESMFELPAADRAYVQAALSFQRAGKLREAAALVIDRAALRLSARWEGPAAARLLSEAGNLYPGHTQDAEFMTRRAIYQAASASLSGDKQARLAAYEQASKLADSSLRDTGARTVLALRILSLTEVDVGRPQQAIERLGGLLARLNAERIEKTAPVSTLSVLADLSGMERFVGQFGQAREHSDAARTLCRQTLNPKGSQCIYGSFQHSILLLFLGFDQLAMDEVPLLIPSQQSDESIWTTLRRVQAFEILARNQQLGRHADLVDRVRKASESPGDGQTEALSGQFLALTAQGRHAMREGRFQEAKQFSDQAQSLITALAAGDEPLALPSQLLHAMSAHAQGEHERALEMLDRLHARQIKTSGADSPFALLVSIHRARCLWSLNRSTEALALLDHALPLLSDAMRGDAPTVARIQTLRQELASTEPGTPELRRKVELFL